MNGLVHRPAIASLLSLAFATGVGLGCAPDNSVKPGAPVLLKFTVVQPGGVTLTIDSSAKICATEVVNGAACRAVAGPAVPPSSGGGAGGSGGDTGTAGSGGSVTGSGGSLGGSGGSAAGSGGSDADGGVTNPDAAAGAGGSSAAGSSAGGSAGESATGAGGSTGEIFPADPVCQNKTTKIWCTCDGTNPDAPVWVCQPLGRVTGVISTFDRLLDTTPLAPGPVAYGGVGAADTVTAAASPGGETPVLTDYTSNGSPFGLLLPLFGAYYYQNFRLDGPSLFTIPDMAFPSDAIVTLTLTGTLVRAKDGKTPFTADGELLLDGILSFATSAFGGAVVASDLIAPDMSTVAVTFTNLVDPTQVEGHITVTAAPGGPVPITLGAIDGNTIGVTPVTAWPAGATLTFTIDATTPNVLGQTLGTAITGTVMTAAN